MTSNIEPRRADAADRPSSATISALPGHAGATADDFKAAFRNYPSGVAVITADDGTGPVALTASSVSSVSVEPPLLVFSLSVLSSSTPVVAASDTVVVHVLDAAHLDLARRCATSGVDRFADPDSWRRLPTGEPLFVDVDTWIRGRIINRMEAGGSLVVAVQALEISHRGDGATAVPPLVYHNRTWHRLDESSRLP